MLTSSSQRPLALLLPLFRLARDEALAVRTRDDSSNRTRRLDLRLDHDAQQLNGVVRDTEPFAKAQRRLPEPSPLLLELLHPCLQLLGHLVEGDRETGELVAPAHRHTFVQVPACDRSRLPGQLAHAAHDHLALEEG